MTHEGAGTPRDQPEAVSERESTSTPRWSTVLAIVVILSIAALPGTFVLSGTRLIGVVVGTTLMVLSLFRREG